MPFVFVVREVEETLALGNTAGEREAIGVVVEAVSHAVIRTTATTERMCARIVAPSA